MPRGKKTESTAVEGPVVEGVSVVKRRRVSEKSAIVVEVQQHVRQLIKDESKTQIRAETLDALERTLTERTKVLQRLSPLADVRPEVERVRRFLSALTEFRGGGGRSI